MPIYLALVPSGSTATIDTSGSLNANILGFSPSVGAKTLKDRELFKCQYTWL